MSTTYTYYISSGAKNAQYTLRRQYEEPVYFNTSNGPGSSLRQRDYHVMNLGIDPEVALEKVKKYIINLRKKSPHDDIQFVAKKPSNTLDDYQTANRGQDKLKFGKYKGKSVHDVIKHDPEYLIWSYFNVKLTDFQKEFIDTELKDKVNSIKQTKSDQDNEAKNKAAKALEQDQIAQKYIDKMNIGDLLHFKGQVVKRKLNDKYQNTSQFTVVTSDGYLAWFQSAKKEFTEFFEYDYHNPLADYRNVAVIKGDTIEVEMTVSGKSDKIVFGKSPKLIKNYK